MHATSSNAAELALATILTHSAHCTQPEKSVDHQLQPGRDIYIHLIQDSTGYKPEANKTVLTLTSASGRTSLKGGDGAFVKLSSTNPNAPQTFTLTGSGIDGAPAEFILFDSKKRSTNIATLAPAQLRPRS
jgi:hypothetical protein